MTSTLPNDNIKKTFEDNISNKLISEIIEDLSGKKIVSKNKVVSGPMEFNTNIKKISEITGWEPKFDIKKGLEKTFDIMRSYYSK